ncbi:MAG: RluA family pseudouridine synthase [Deltaproteobacteria bacterium]|nr:RluA family pseudouridine synthase [Deltaproteobacteria bacterium]
MSRPRRSRPEVAVPPGCDPTSILLTFPVAPEHAGQRLDRFVQSRIPRLSRTRAQEIVRSCAYRADGTRRRPSERVRTGETVLLVRPPFEEPHVPLFFDVLYEDDAILAVDKPSGLPVHPSATYHKNTLTFLLRERFGNDAPQIAHRLDRETSGLLLCGRTPEAERALKNAFESRRVSKRYLAIVRGVIPDDEGRIELPIDQAKEGLRILMEVTPPGEGYPSVTRFRVVARSDQATLVALAPESGRQHQLRVHLSALGFPILGDKLYGPEGVQPFLDYIETGMTDELRQRLGHERQALHAYELTFDHPTSGDRLTLHAPLPDDLIALWGAPLDSATLASVGAC